MGKRKLQVVGIVAAGVFALISATSPYCAAEEGGTVPADVARLAEKGEAIFQDRCSVCHSIGGGDRATGPDLEGVAERRDRQWVLRIIRDPARLAAEKDPQMAALMEKYAMTMPDLGVSEVEAQALLVFLFHAGEEEHGEAVAPPEPAKAEGDAERGRALFVGEIPFSQGGAPCLACHGFAGLGGAGGAGFGGDLTAIHEDYGDEAVASILADLPFPSMEPIFAERPLTEAEQADLAAFFRSSAGEERPSIGGKLATQVLIVFAVLLLLTFLFGMKRLRGVRRSLLEKTSTKSEG